MFTIYKSNTYISSLVVQGFDPSKEIVEVINYYISTVTPFVFYTISLFSLGYVVKKIDCIIKNQTLKIENYQSLYNESDFEDEEIDNFFSEI